MPLYGLKHTARMVPTLKKYVTATSYNVLEDIRYSKTTTCLPLLKELNANTKHIDGLTLEQCRSLAASVTRWWTTGSSTEWTDFPERLVRCCMDAGCPTRKGWTCNHRTALLNLVAYLGRKSHPCCIKEPMANHMQLKRVNWFSKWSGLGLHGWGFCHSYGVNLWSVITNDWLLYVCKRWKFSLLLVFIKVKDFYLTVTVKSLRLLRSDSNNWNKKENFK